MELKSSCINKKIMPQNTCTNTGCYINSKLKPAIQGVYKSSHLALLAVQVELVLTDCHGPDTFCQLLIACKPCVDVYVTRAKCASAYGHSTTIPQRQN